MNVLLVSVDSLRWDFLSAYRERPLGYDYEVETPNFDRFAERATTFDRHYAGSLFCMPARREWLTGVREFLWRTWGPVEPFDETLPRLARSAGTPAALVTDHYHYFQHGSHGYYEDFSGFEFVRGHEYDAWRTAPREIDPEFAAQLGASDPESQRFTNRAQYARNVASLTPERESEFFAPRVFARAIEWLRANEVWDEWFCYVDSFDVHEPFHCPEPYASMYTDEDPTDPEMPVWPRWGRIDEGQSELSADQLAFVKAQFAGKVTMVDRWFGRLLDRLDRRELWDDTLVVVTSDHGFSLGDHGWLGKIDGPLYDTLARTPLLVWHPDHSDDVERVEALTSAVDLHPTLATAVGDVEDHGPHGRNLLPLLREDAEEIRKWALYGIWGSDVNVTDGEHTYHRRCDEDVPTYQHSTTMLDPYGVFQPPEPATDAEAGTYLPYTDTPVWRHEGMSNSRQDGSLLFDVSADERQRDDLVGLEPDLEREMQELLVEALDALDAPEREYERVGLDTS
ncbi:sulfatase-like hydrolase/transferase [Halorussus salinisoli]|uniref:sulfatase-like hydrolase/transferase n=1 Tax=Halorussus salinisoli TaxID=2558242 RepID=UPI0010C1FD1A|nr:sulfatase-like hydrolase/transferase [Halorussus salinisoli]